MNKEVLDSLRETLELDQAVEVGRFGVFIDSSDSRHDRYYIKANTEGLKLFAYQLLCASKDLADQENDTSFSPIDLTDDIWIYSHSDIHLSYIEHASIKNEGISDAPKETWKDWFWKIGCGLIAVFLLISLLVGIVTVFTYLS